MPEPDKAAVVAREWIGKADNDLKTAAQTLKLGTDSPTDTVCFHAQQCVEKCLKAGLISLGIAFPRTHDINHRTDADKRRAGPNAYRVILLASN